MAEQPLGAQISAMLQDRGVDVIFGIPGVHNIEMYRGIEDSGLRHVLARHEQGAGFMADGYARATGKPGVAYVISGPGLTNVMTPMGQAYSDSIPMLVISSCLDETSATRGQLHQMLDQAGAARTVCDWSEEARTASAAFGLIDRAFAEFSGARPRPKHIQVPIALAGTRSGGFPKKSTLPKLQPDGAEMQAVVAEMITEAKRPIFVFGGGATGLAEDKLAQELVEKSGGACFLTYAGRGIVPGDCATNFGSFLGRPESKTIIATADLVVAIGTELSECDLWRDDLGHVAPMIRVDIDPEVLADRHRAEVQVLVEAKAFISSLLPRISARRTKGGWSAQEVASARETWRAAADTDRPAIVPVCAALQNVLPPDVMVFSDMTQFAYVAKEVWDMPAPRLWHHPTGFGTLGYALPAAIGGKVGRGNKPVIAIAGDYGFQYTLQELGTAAELGLSLPILIWDNEALKEIADAMQESQIAPFAVHAKNPDFGKLAEAYGVGYTKPVDLAALESDVLSALRAAGPTIIHMTPKLASGLL